MEATDLAYEPNWNSCINTPRATVNVKNGVCYIEKGPYMDGTTYKVDFYSNEGSLINTAKIQEDHQLEAYLNQLMS